MKKVIVSFSLITAISVSGIFSAFADTQEDLLSSNISSDYEYSPEDSYIEHSDIDYESSSDAENKETTAYAENDIFVSESDTDSEISDDTTYETSQEPESTATDEYIDNTSTSDAFVEEETEFVQEDSLNDNVTVTRIIAKAADSYIESYYTKYGNDFFKKRMYDKYDETAKTYNITYTVYLSDGSTFIGNKDELYAKFGDYPAYYDKAGDYSGSSELIIQEKFLNTTYFIRFRLIAHTHTIVTDPAVAATETATGLTEGSHCTVCGEIIVAQEVVPTLQKHTGWYNAGGTWFYYDSNGKMVTGWLYRGQENGIDIWYYLNDSGAMITGWKYINNRWYYFNASGRMAVGWTYVNGTWYFMGSSGAMYSGWQYINNCWYYLNSSGAMATGWQYINSKWYFFNSSGVMATGWLYRGTNGGNEIWYYFNDSGAMVTGWKTIKAKQYYFNASGRMAIGWLKLDSTWYYMNPSGAMTTGWQKVNGYWYFMNSGGAMLANQWFLQNSRYYFLQSGGQMKTGWLYRNGNWYYFNDSGVMQSLAWLTYKNKKYYFGKSGKMVTEVTEVDGQKYYFNSDGTLVTETGWTTVDGHKYYINSDGSLATGLRKIDDKMYFFDSNGRLYTGWKVINGVQYYFKSTGETAIGWLHTDGDHDGVEEWYYFDSDGSMYVGFLELNGSEYYFDTTSNDTYRGILRIGTFTVNGITYVTDSDGAITGKHDQDNSLSDDQIALIESALSTPTTSLGYCAAWVDIVLQNAGFSSYFSYLRPSQYAYAHENGLITSEEYAYDTAFNANDYWAYVCYSSNEDDLEPGMIVATRSTYTTLGKQFGHVGIYLGDGKVISSVGYIEILSLSEWNDRYNNTSYGSTIKWGFIPAMR